MRTYKIRWAIGEKVEIYVMSAASAADARKAFDIVRVPGVRVLSVDLVDDSGESSLGKTCPVRPRPSGPLRAAQDLENEGGA